jgi:hypothetical protein
MRKTGILIVIFFSLICTFVVSAQQPIDHPAAQPASRMIPVPQKLADDYARALEAERQALQAAMQTPEYKDFQTAQQQRLRAEVFIAGEVGCKPSLAKFPRDEQGRLVIKDGRIEAIECLSSKELKP